MFNGKDFLYSIDTEKELRGVSVYNNKICILTAGEALIYNKKGEKTDEIKLDSVFDDVILKGRKVYLINSIEIERKKF